jgi:hypothetical protein
VVGMNVKGSIEKRVRRRLTWDATTLWEFELRILGFRYASKTLADRWLTSRTTYSPRLHIHRVGYEVNGRSRKVR